MKKGPGLILELCINGFVSLSSIAKYTRRHELGRLRFNGQYWHLEYSAWPWV